MISRRAQSISPSETLQISAKAKELKREGKSVISLSAGEPDFKTPDHICEAAIKAIKEGFHGYTMNTGMPELREAIATKLKRDNELNYESTQIVCTNGAKQALGFSILALLDEGDEAVIPAPYWVSYPQMVKMAGAEPVTVRTNIDNHYKITPQQLDEAITDKTKLFILCSPSNPTGTRYTAEELKALGEVLAEHPGVSVISDEIYEYIVFEEEHRSILQEAPQLYDRTVLINGFSKGFAMTGWRLGYLAAPQPVADAVAKIQSQETSAPSAISQKAGIEAYNGELAEVESMVSAYNKRRDYVIERLKQLPGVTCFTPGGAFYVFPDISDYLGKESPAGQTVETSTDLCMYLLEEQGLAAVPGDAFGEPNGIRLSYAASMEELEEGLDRLEEGLKKLD